jgi:quercetin dioxygenase-like cupin family protein
MGEIFQVDESDIPWAEFGDVEESDGQPSIRYKVLSPRGADVPPMQYVEYPPGHEDAAHRHQTGEVLIVTAGQLQLGDEVSGPGSAVYVPRDTEYAIRAGESGVRFFRIVVP